jgi:hypothetical protein
LNFAIENAVEDFHSEAAKAGFDYPVLEGEALTVEAMYVAGLAGYHRHRDQSSRDNRW